MAEKIKIAELSLDPKKLLSELEKTKKSVDELAAKQKVLKAAGDTTSKTFIQNEANLKSLKTEYNSQLKTLQQVENGNRDLNNLLNQEIKSLAAAETNNKKLRQARANLNLATEEGKKALQEINKQIDANTDFMKENQDQQVQLKMNIGNYKDDILEATGLQRAYTVSTKTLTTAQSVMNVVVGKSTGAMKAFRIALASTGIGAIVLVLGSLITYLTSTQDGINKVNRVLTPLGEIFNSLLGVVQDFGKAIFEAFSNPKQLISDIGTAIKTNLINRFTALGKIVDSFLSGDWSGVGDGVLQAATGVENLTDKVKNIGKQTSDFFATAIKRGNEIQRITEELSRGEAEYVKAQGQLRQEFKEQNRLAEDQTKSQAEREAAARRSIEIQEQISKNATNRLKLEADLIRLQQQANDTSDAEATQLAEKLAQINDAVAAEEEAITTQQNKLNSIVKAGYDARKKIRDEAIQSNLTKLEEEYALYQEQQRLKNTSDEERIAQMRANADKEQEILDYKLKNKLISETEYATASLKLQNDIREKQAQMAEADLARVEAFNERKQALENELYLNNLASDEERELKKLDIEREREEAELERMQLSAERKAELQKLLDAKYNQEYTATQKKWDEQRLADEKKRDEIALQHKRDIANARFSIAAGLSGLLNELAGEDAATQKALLIFEQGIAATRAIINTAQGVTAAIAASPLTGGMPWSGIIAAQGAIQLATITAQTVNGIKGINKSKKEENNSKRFAKGGLLKGASHAAGGIKTPWGELEGEEAVINKRSTRMFAPLLSAINVAGGGRKFASGGMLDNSSVVSGQLINYDLLAAKVAEANSSLPAPQVSVEEINNTQTRVNTIENRASF